MTSSGDVRLFFGKIWSPVVRGNLSWYLRGGGSKPSFLGGFILNLGHVSQLIIELGSNGAPNCSSNHQNFPHIGFDGSRTKDQWYSLGGPKRARLIWARVPKMANIRPKLGKKSIFLTLLFIRR